MQHFFLVVVFFVGLILNVANSIAAPGELNYLPMSITSQSEEIASFRQSEYLAYSNENQTASDASPMLVKFNEPGEPSDAIAAVIATEESAVSAESPVEEGAAEPVVEESPPPLKRVRRSALVAYTGAESLEASSSLPSSKQNFAIIPMGGGTGFLGDWNSHISNHYSLGLVLEFPISTKTSLEVEGTYGKYDISYSYLIHDFEQYSLGSNLKFYLTESQLRPYLGVGISALHYANMSRGYGSYPYAYDYYYSRWVGAAQAMLGADMGLSQNVSLGLRGSYVLPFINRPDTYTTAWGTAYPGYEEAAAINTHFYRVMGTARIAF